MMIYTMLFAMLTLQILGKS